MKTSSKIIAVAIICCTALTINQSIGETKKIQEQISISNIGSFINPIILKGAKNINHLQKMQQDYIKKHYPEWQILGNGYAPDFNIVTNTKGDRYLQVYYMLDNEGDKKVIYFDYTEIYKKLKKSNKKDIKKQIEELDEMNTPPKPEE